MDVVKQSNLLGEYQLILINNNKDKKINKAITNSIENCTQNYQEIEIIKVEGQSINNIYEKLIDIVQGDFLIFTQSNFYPENDWLENIISSFNDDRINIVAGKVIQVNTTNIVKKLSYFISQLINQNQILWNNIYDNQIANLAFRKKFIKQQQSLKLAYITQKNINFYYRILREVEAEIIYNPSSIVYQRQC